MTRADLEKHRTRRDRSRGQARESNERADGSRPLGAIVVALLVGVGGLADLAVGVGLLASPLFLVGVVVAAIGAVKLWAAVGLARLRARALGLAVLLHVVGAMLGAGRALFAAATGGAPGPDAVRVLVDAGIVCYLLVIADRFE